MGYAIAVGRCFGCGKTFSFNPSTVPSIRVNRNGQPDANGKREPVCRECIETANPKRIANGLPPIEIPADAYEPCDERDVG